MQKTIALFAAVMSAALLSVPLDSAAKASHSSGGSHSSTSGGHHSDSGSHSHKAQGVTRDSHGRIARSSHAKRDFQKGHPCPATGRSSGACPGYVIDHVKPLKRGGAYSPSNIQWQTRQAAKEKDKTE